MTFSRQPPMLWFPKTGIPGWLFFGMLVAFASVRAQAASANSDSDDALSDFTNDLFTDLGPLLALFGEQMTKQYISESTTFYDYFIFGMGPIGVITTIVSTIRLCGPASLRAFIGRSQEGNSAIEAELCTSTSRDVCEVFNNGGITRVLGRPKLLELIHVPKKYLPVVKPSREMNWKTGLYLFRDFVDDARCGQGLKPTTAPEWSLSRSQQLGPASQNPPNLSLNVGITQYDPWIFRLVASVGLILQAGVLVVAGVGVWVLGWNLNESTTASTNYAPTMFIIGTVFMCGGMCASIAIIGQATTEVRCRRAPAVTGSPMTSLIWLQPRQVIADQSFDAYAFIEDPEKRLLVWTSSMKTWDLDPGSERRFKLATCIAVSAVLVGYILQFIGLRGMRAWVSMAQLITTVIMSILRGMLRMQRVKKDDNQLLSKADLIQGHELDWLAVEISQRDILNEPSTPEESHTNLTEAELLSPWATEPVTTSQQSYQNLMNLRICLTRMTDSVSPNVIQTRSKHSQVPWGIEGSKFHEKARELAGALEQVANIFCRKNPKTMISLNLPGSQFCRLPGITNGGSQIEKGFNFELRRRSDQLSSKWKVDRVEIEAALGLTVWCLISDRRLLYCEVRSRLESTRAEDVPKKRVISAGLDPQKMYGELELACWRGMLDISHSEIFHKHDLSEKMTLPLDANLDSYSLGSLWQANQPRTASDSPLKDLEERRWIEILGQNVPIVELQDSPIFLQRLCGWSCVLRAQQDIQWAKQSLSKKAFGHPKDLPKTMCIQFKPIPDPSLLDICVQELFGAFLASLQLEGGHHDNCAPVHSRFDVQRLKKRAETINSIAQIFSESGLGSDIDAIDCILPALENRQIGDLDRVISIISSTCDILLERSESTEALRIAEMAFEALHKPETKEEERSLARALCVLSRIQRFEMGNDRGPRIRTYYSDMCGDLWEQATRRREEGHFRLATVEELRRFHDSLWECYGDNEGKNAVVYEGLLGALEKRDRFETLRSLCFLTKDGVNSFLAQKKHSVSAALPMAAKQGWFEAVDAMLSLGFDPLAQDEAGRTALGYCAEYGQFEHEVCVEIILGHAKAFNALKSVSWPADDGRTPLLWAIDQCHDEMVRILLKNGCSVNEQGARELSPLGDLSPLGEAISNDLKGIVRQLIDAGAELRPEHIDAAKYGDSQDIKQLIFGYLRLLVHECPDRWVQHLPDVIEHGDVSTVEALLHRGVRCSFEHIVLAVRKGQPEVQSLFFGLLHRCVEDDPTYTKEWLLKLAEEDDHDTLRALLDNGASVLWNSAQA